MSQDEKNNGFENQESNRGKEPIQYVQVTPYGYPPEDDEIDLADLFAVLYRRKKLVAAVTILFVLLAFGASQMMPKKYKAETMVEIGQVPIDGKYQKVEDPEAVKNRISSLAKLIALEMTTEKKSETDPLGFSIKDDLNLELPKEGNIATIDLLVSEKNSAKALAFLVRLNEKLIKDYELMLKQYENEILSSINMGRIEIKKIESKIANSKKNIAFTEEQYSALMKAKEARISELEQVLNNTRENREILRKDIATLQQEKESLADRIKETESRYAELLEAGSAKGGNSSEIMLLLRQEADYLSQMRERQLVQIPQTIRQLEYELNELDEKTKTIQLEKATEMDALLGLHQELNNEIEEIQHQILDLVEEKEKINISIKQNELKLDSMIKTNVFVKPRLSDNPVSPNVKLIVALGLVGGFFLAVFLAFMAEFWYRNKQKITG
jgi:capsular polysaccharide biosynthesis protein